MLPSDSGNASQTNRVPISESPELLRLREYLKSTATGWPSREEPSRIVVTDIQMPMRAMCRFMVKWSIASIPAALILFVLGLVLGGIVMVVRTIL